MKFKTTKKAMKENYSTILSIGYCNAQNLLSFENEIAYSTRAEGHACDYYDVDGVCISTGYSPIGQSVDYSLIKKYDDLARDIRNDYEMKYETRKEAVHDLLVQFVGYAIAK